MMKKWVFFHAMLFTAINCLGQYITADEMIEKIKCPTFDCYNSFIVSKGFSFEPGENSGNDKIFLFLSNKSLNSNNPRITARNSSMIVLSRNGITNVGFRTTNSEYYNKMLAAFGSKGFNFLYSKNTSKGISSTYTSDRYPGMMMSVDVERLTKSGENWVSYDFELYR